MIPLTDSMERMFVHDRPSAVIPEEFLQKWLDPELGSMMRETAMAKLDLTMLQLALEIN